MEQNKSNTGIKFEEMVLWESGSQSYFRSLSVTVIPWGVTLKLTVVSFLAASSVDKRSTVRCTVLALVSISTLHCPRYISEPTVSRKKKPNKSKQISASKLLIKSAILDISEVIGRNLSGDGAIHQRANNTQDISVIRDCYRVRDVVKMKMFHTTTRQIPFPFGHDWLSSVSADWVLSSPERSGNKKKYKQTQNM